MKESRVGHEQALVAHDEPAEGAEPRKGTLDDPAVTVAAQLPPVLMGGVRVIRVGGEERLDPALGEPRPQPVGVIGPVGDQPVGALAGRPGVCARGTAMVASVRSRSVTSCGDAESRCAPSGVPAPSTTTIHLVPLPRLVFPTAAPPFSPGRSCRRRNTRPSAACPCHGDRRGTPATTRATSRRLPNRAGGANTSPGSRIVRAPRSTARPSRAPRESRRSISGRPRAGARPAATASVWGGTCAPGPTVHWKVPATSPTFASALLWSPSATPHRGYQPGRGFETSSSQSVVERSRTGRSPAVLLRPIDDPAATGIARSAI
jgi:hypothetical protein